VDNVETAAIDITSLGTNAMWDVINNESIRDIEIDDDEKKDAECVAKDWLSLC